MIRSRFLVYLSLIALFFSYQNCNQKLSGKESATQASTGTTTTTTTTTTNTSNTTNNVTADPPNSSAALYASNGGITPSGLTMTPKFQIQPGIGSGPWNAASNPIEVFVGQTLTIENKDSVAHSYDGAGKPCANMTIQPNASVTCVVSSQANSVLIGGDNIFDGISGPRAKIFIVSYSGLSLYNYNCAGCHNPIASSQYRQATVADIKRGINNVGAMKVVNLQSLTDRQLEAIQKALE